MHVVKREASDAETIYYVYVVGADNKLIGVLTLRDLLINDDDQMITDIMTTPVMSVKVSDDQAEVAQTIRDYNFLAIPVTRSAKGADNPLDLSWAHMPRYRLHYRYTSHQ